MNRIKPGHISKIKHDKLDLTRAQILAISELTADLPQSRPATIEQIVTKRGGRHTYVTVPKDGEYHVAKNGNTAMMGWFRQTEPNKGELDTITPRPWYERGF
jgi:hypothetical protein